MEELNYNFFFHLTKYNLQSSIIYFVLTLFDFLQIFSYYYELPIKCINFLLSSNYPISSFSINSNHAYATYLKHLSLYFYYRKLLIEDPTNNTFIYPQYFIYIIIGLYVYLLVTFITITYSTRVTQEKTQNSNWCTSTYLLVIINFYNLLFFRLFALCIYDTCFNCIINSTSYLLILMLVFAFLLVFSYYYYFSSFCLCVKFDINYKHQLSNILGKDIDYFLLLMKILMTIEVNYTSHNKEQVDFFSMFFIILNIAALLFLIYRLLFRTITALDCFKGIGIVSFLLSFILGCLFPQVRSSGFLFTLFILLVFSLPSIIIISMRNRRIKTIIRSRGDYMHKFTLLFEYYQTNSFSSLLNQMVINEKKALLIGFEKEGKIFSKYLSHLKRKLKGEYKESQTVDALFYYILSLIYIAIINKEYNTFKLIFKISKAKKQIKENRQFYYLNISFFYNLLQYDINTRGNVDSFKMNYSFHQLHEEIHKCILSFDQFIDKEAFNTPNEYFAFSSYFNSFVFKVKEHYKVLEAEKTEEYQKTIFRILIESIRNKSIKKQENKFDLFIKEEIFNQEDMLEKEYNNNNMIKLKIHLNTLGCTIMKIGHQLNYLNTKDFFNLFPLKFRKLATDLFYGSVSRKNLLKDTRELRIENFETFHFFVKDQHETDLEFLLMYKLFPDINSDTLYLDGKYTLSSEGFLITETMHTNERMVLISSNLSKLLYVDQAYLSLVNEYQSIFSLNMFIADINEFFSNKKIIEALLKQINTLSSIASVEDYSVLQQMHYKLSSKRSEKSQMIKLELKYSMSQQDNVEKYNVYRVLKQNTATGQAKYVNNFDTTMQKTSKSPPKEQTEAEEGQAALLMTAYDTTSVSSSASKLSYSTGGRTSSVKKKNSKKDVNSSNYLVLVFGTLIILLSIVLLIIENSNNNSLGLHVEMFQITLQLNRVMLNSVISFYALVCYDNPPKKVNGKSLCINRFTQYLAPLGLVPLEEFAKKELVVKLGTLHSRWDLYKRKSISLNNHQIISIINKPSHSSHLTYANGQFSNKPTLGTLEETITIYINKMTMISLLKDFNKIDIYPLFVDDNFIPLYFENRKIGLSPSQLEIYETLFSFFDYSIDLFIIQNSIQTETEAKIKNTASSIIIFITTLIVLNWVMFFIFLLIFHQGNKTIRQMMYKTDLKLQNEEHSTRLRTKMGLLKDLTKLYKENPVLLAQRIKETYKRDTLKKGKTNETDKAEAKQTISNTLKKEYNLSFVTKYSKIKLIIVEVIYMAYCFIFLSLFIIDFDNIRMSVNIMKNSGLVEELTYLSIASMQMMEFSNITEYTLYTKLFQNETKGRFFESMVNLIEENRHGENLEKNQLYSQYSKAINQFNYTCNTLYASLNDTRFNLIIQSNPNQNYNSYLKGFCSQVKILLFNDEKKFLNEIVYGNMKLVGKPKANSFAINLPKDTNELYYLLSELLFVYRPLRAYISNFYYTEIPNYVLNLHFTYLLIFLIGNIGIQIVNFLIYKFFIIDRIEKDIHDLRDVEIAISL